MALTPKARSLVLYEGAGEGTPFGDMNIPEIIATMQNSFGTTKRPVDQIQGGIAAFDAIDALVQRLEALT